MTTRNRPVPSFRPPLDLDGPFPDPVDLQAGADPASFDVQTDPVDLPFDLILDDTPSTSGLLPGLEAYLAAGIPWDIAITLDPGEDAELAARHYRRQLADLDDDEQAYAEPAFDPLAVIPVVKWFRRTLNRRLDQREVDTATVDLALRLGDLLAASDNGLDALTVYREILERLLETGGPGADRVAERAGAVLSRHDLRDSLQPTVADLISMMPTAAVDPERSDRLYAAMVSSARRDLADIGLFQQGLKGLQQILNSRLSREVSAELDATAMRNGAAALVQLNDLGPAGGRRDAFGELVGAIMDTDLRTARIVARERGRQKRVRFADHCILTSPLPKEAGRDNCVRAVLDTPLRSRPGITLRDVMSAVGAFPEDSEVLLREWREEFGLADCDVVINCPRLLQNRPAPSQPGPNSAPGPRLASVVVTSLGWAGAADVGAFLADSWNWGFTAANDAQRLLAFGDWTDNDDQSQQQADAAQRLLRTTNTLLDALPDLPRRVCALDEPRGAVRALAGRSSIGSAEEPVAIVAIMMSVRRMRWVAQHMVSHGGALKPAPGQVEQRLAELDALQRDLREVVENCRSDATPVLVVDLDDHLEDGYAEQTGNDPVDEDLDCFYRTAERVRTALEAAVQLVADGPARLPR